MEACGASASITWRACWCSIFCRCADFAGVSGCLGGAAGDPACAFQAPRTVFQGGDEAARDRLDAADRAAQGAGEHRPGLVLAAPVDGMQDGGFEVALEAAGQVVGGGALMMGGPGR